MGRLHRTPPEGLSLFPPAAQLQAAAESARSVAHIAPGLAPRLRVLMARLEASAPGPVEPVACHGDFSARQLIQGSRGLVLIDFDTMCAAPAALDQAAYFADLIRGNPHDLDHALAVLDTLLQGYGERPAELSWYLSTMLLRRARRPFRYQDEHWPAHVEGMVAAAEVVAR
jgi:Ser/Thr protein kinase RdoA (MazF antagonist)